MSIDEFVDCVQLETGNGSIGCGFGYGTCYEWGSGFIELTYCGSGSGWGSGTGRGDGSGYGTGRGPRADTGTGISNGRGEGAGYGSSYGTGGKRTWL